MKPDDNDRTFQSRDISSQSAPRRVNMKHGGPTKLNKTTI